MTEIDWEEFERAFKERGEVQDTHRWTYRCFPPGPTTCAVCGAAITDPDLKRCLTWEDEVGILDP